MPRQNGMGPTGAGPMTGRGMGLCTKSSNLSGTRLGLGRRQGRGLGIRRGAGRCYYGDVVEEDDKAFLERQKTILEASLDNIKTRLSELDEEK